MKAPEDLGKMLPVIEPVLLVLHYIFCVIGIKYTITAERRA